MAINVHEKIPINNYVPAIPKHVKMVYAFLLAFFLKQDIYQQAVVSKNASEPTEAEENTQIELGLDPEQAWAASGMFGTVRQSPAEALLTQSLIHRAGWMLFIPFS